MKYFTVDILEAAEEEGVTYVKGIWAGMFKRGNIQISIIWKFTCRKCIHRK